MRQWFVGVCEANVICKGKRGRVLNQEQAGTLSPRSTKQLCRLRSQLRQVEYGLIKDRRNGNFNPVPADKRVLFHQLMRFLLENVRI